MLNDELTTKLFHEVDQRFYGKHRGIVTDTADPLERGRIKAKVPDVLGEVETGWCTPCAPYAGRNRGWFVLPEVGDGVWIEFEAGNYSLPIWTGAWWGDDELPNAPGGKSPTPATKIFKSASGLIVELDDDAKEIKISDGDGANIITITADGGRIVVEAAGDVTLQAPSINLGDSASHPIVFGDALLNYLSQLTATLSGHFHTLGPAPTSPPVLPFMPPDPGLLSTVSKTK